MLKLLRRMETPPCVRVASTALVDENERAIEQTSLQVFNFGKKGFSCNFLRDQPLCCFLFDLTFRCRSKSRELSFLSGFLPPRTHPALWKDYPDLLRTLPKSLSFTTHRSKNLSYLRDESSELLRLAGRRGFE